MTRKPPLSPVNSVLNKVVNSLGLERRLREHTFMSLWSSFLEGRLCERSRPLFIDAQGNLVVSVADAATGQELSMLRGRLLPRIQKTAAGLNIDVRGLRLDMKHFHQQTTMAELPEAKPLPKPTAADLEAVLLSAEEEEQCRRLHADLAAGPESVIDASKLVRLFQQSVRLRRWQLTAGYPVCPRCGNPAERLLRQDAQAKPGAPGQAPLCMTCFFAD